MSLEYVALGIVIFVGFVFLSGILNSTNVLKVSLASLLMAVLLAGCEEEQVPEKNVSPRSSPDARLAAVW